MGDLPRARGPIARAIRFILSLSLLTVPFTQPVLSPPAAFAGSGPVLSVTTTVDNTLLGGQTVAHVTVSNNTSDTSLTGKAYNVSITTTFTSSVSPSGTVTLVSASDSNGSAVANSNTFNPVTGARTVNFVNLKDLAPGESYTLNIVVDTSGDPRWEVGQKLIENSSATFNSQPDNNGTVYNGTAAAQADILPLTLNKTVQQSTGIDQASGTQTRAYTYTLHVQNNYKNPSASVVVTDVIPDGIQYLGMVSGPAPSFDSTPDPVTGIRTLSWNLGTLTPSQTVDIVYQTGIRYDWYGTGNGGTNRAWNATSSPSASDTPIPEHAGLVNTSTVGAQYKGSLASTISVNNTSTASVKTAYVTLDKTGGPTTVGYGSTVNFSIVVASSQYYASDGLTVRDILPDGLTYTTGSANIPPASVVHNSSSGTSTITWGPSQLSTIAPSGNITITLAATVNTTWEGAPLTGQPIRAGDTFTNRSELDGTWHDQYKSRTLTETIINQATVAMGTGLPDITKDVWDAASGTWSKATSATVGDKLTFRVRFNTTDGATPTKQNITMGYTSVTDWLPKGFAYNNDAVVVRSPDASFSVPTTGSPPPLNLTTPTAVSLGTSPNDISGESWFLGDVGANAWWQATFTATVTNDAAIQNGTVGTNYWKLTGVDSSGQTYSKRDANTINYVLPNCTITKGSPPTYMVPGQNATYTISVQNTGLSPARDVTVVDTLPVGMRSHTPTITSITLAGVPLTPTVSYKLNPAYDSATGVFTVDLYDTTAPAVDTSIAAGATLLINLVAQPDSGVGAGASFTNTASVSWSSDNVGGRPGSATSTAVTKQVQPLTVTKALEATSTSFTVGSTMSYDVTVTVPQGTKAYWPRINDVINRDGVAYVPFSATLTNISGSPPVPASFAPTIALDPSVVVTAGANATRIYWDLSTVDNSGTASDYVFGLRFQYVATGLLDSGLADMIVPNVGATTNTMVDTATVGWGDVNLGQGVADQNATATPTPVTATIAQPRLRNAKVAITPGPYSGGMPISYETTFTNDGSSIAYTPSWRDVLPSQLGTATLISVKRTVAGVTTTLTSGADYTPSFSVLPTISISFAPSITVGVGDKIAVRYTTSIIPTAGASSVITNTSDVNWTSLPTSTASFARVYNDSPSASSGENVTSDTVSLGLPIAPATLVKTVLTTTTPTIGDIVQYRLRVTVPTETILYGTPGNLFLNDVLATDGLSYLVGSAQVTTISGNPASNAVLSGATFTTAPVNGASLRFDFANDISNASTLPVVGDTPYVFEITFQMQVTGLSDTGVWIWPPTPSIASADTGTLTWRDSSTASFTTRTASSAALVTVRQPKLQVSKSFSSPTVPASGIITATVRVSNVGSSTAYPYDSGPSLVDTIPAQFTAPQMVSATASWGVLAAGSDYTTAYAAPRFAVTYSANTSIPAGQSIVFVYTMQLLPTAGAGSVATNSADANWSSEPGIVAGERTYDDSNNAIEGTQDTTSTTTTVPSATIQKRISSAGTTYTIGDFVTYEVTVTVPPGTSLYSAVVTDTVQDGMTVTAVTVPFGTTAVGSKSAAGQSVTWALNPAPPFFQTSNPPSSTAVMHVTARVDDTRTAGGQVLAGSSLNNTATLGWNDAAVGGVLRTVSATAPLTVVEPSLSIAKAASTASVSAGDVVTYTVSITNAGTSPARDLLFTDKVPSAFYNAGVSPTLVSAAIGATTLTAGVDYNADFVSSQTADITFTPTTVLNPAQTLTIKYRAAVPAGITQGTLFVNNAAISYASQTGAVYKRAYGPTSTQTTVSALSPALVTAKSVNDVWVQRGETVTFTVTARNVGGADARNASIIDTLPTGLTYVAGSAAFATPSGTTTTDPAIAGQTLTWAPANVLHASEVATLTFRATVAAGASLGLMTNNAQVFAKDAGGASVPASNSAYIAADTDPADSPSATLTVTNPSVTTTKTLLGGQKNPIRPGETATMTIAVRNSGDTTLTTVQLTDAFDSSAFSFTSASIAPSTSAAGLLTWNNLGTFAPGAVTTVTVSFLATGAVMATVDTATVNATDLHGDPAPVATSTATIVVRRIGVTLTKLLHAGQPANVPVGGSLAYDIVVKNSGDTTLTYMPLADTYDNTRLAYVSATPSEDTSVAPTVTWSDLTSTFGPFAAGQVQTVTVNFRVTAPGNAIVDTATVAGAHDTGGDLAPTVNATNSAASGTCPTLTIAKQASVTTAAAGDTVTYSVDVTNTGASAAYNIFWHDAVSSALFATGTSPALVGITLNGVPLAPADYSAVFGAAPTSTIAFASTFVLAPTDHLRITYAAKVAAGVSAGLSMPNTATVDSYDSMLAGGATYGPISAPATVTAVAPSLSASKAINDSWVQRGEVVTYTVTVTNVGNGPAYSASIDDTLPAGLTYAGGSSRATWPSGSSTADPSIAGQHMTWSLPATLQAGQALTLTYRASVDATAPLGSLTNTAQGAAVDGGGAPVPPASASVTTTVTNPLVGIVKAPIAGQDMFIQPGQPATFTVVVTNLGDSTLSTVPVNDVFDSLKLGSATATPAATIATPTISWTDVTGAGSLAPGASATLTVSYKALAGAGAAIDTATVSGAIDTHGDSAPTSVSVSDVTITNPGVSIAKTLVGPASVPVGGNVSYNIVVKNTGDSQLTTLPVTDTFDSAHLAYVSASPAETSVTTPTVTWTGLPPLAPGAQTTISATFRVIAAGASIVDTAAVTATDVNGDPGGSKTATNAVLSGTRPTLTIAKAASVTTAAAGDTVTYTVTVANTGASAAYNVSWNDVVSPQLFSAGVSPVLAGITLDAAPLVAGPDYTASFGASTTSTVSFTATLPAGSAYHITYSAKVPGGVHSGDALDNTASVSSYTSLPSGGAMFGPVSANATVTAKSPAFVTAKSHISASTVQRGGLVTWQVSVTNVGDAPASGATLADVLPAGLTYAFGSSMLVPGGPIADPAGGSGPVLTWPVGTLAPGQTATVRFDSLVTTGAPFAVATNTVSAAGFDAAGTAVPADASAWIAADTDHTDSASAAVLVTNPHVSITKAPHPGQDLFVQAGQPVSFDIVVTNDGDTVLPSVPVTDTFDSARLAYVSAAPGATNVSTPTVGWANIGSLNPGQTETVTVNFAALATTGSAGDTAVTAPVLDTNGDPVSSATASSAVTVTHPQVSVAKTLVGPPSVPVGGYVSYDLRVTNTGDTTLTTVPLSDTFDAGHLSFSSAIPAETSVVPPKVSWANVGPLASGESTTVVATFHITAPGSAIADTASVIGATDVNTDTAPATETVNSVLTAVQPQLTIAKHASVATGAAGDTVTYSVDITNTGDGAAWNINWHDVMPAALVSTGTSPAFVDAQINGVPMAPANYTQVFGAGATSIFAFAPGVPLSPGSRLTIIYSATLNGGVHSGDVLTNTATIDSYTSLPGGGATFGPVSASAAVTAASPALATGKSRVSAATTQRGRQVTWRYTIANVGDAAASAVSANDVLPAGFEYVPGSSATSAGPVADPTGGSGPALSWQLGALPAGESVTLTFRALVTTVAPIGTATNLASADATDGGGAPVPADASGWLPADTDITDSSQASVLVTNPKLGLVKQLSVGQGATVKSGGPVSFDLVISNLGDTTATLIPLDDAFDASRLVYSSASPSENSSTAASLHWSNVATLAPGAVTTVTVQFTAAVGNPGSASNDATITGATDVNGDPIPVVESSASVLVARPEVTVRKLLAVGQSASVPIGGVVDYDLVVTNSGDSTIAALPLADTFDSAHLAFAGATPSPSATGGANIAWADLVPALGQLAPGKTVTATVSFTAIATGTAIADTATVAGAVDIYGGGALTTDSVNSLLTVTAPHLTIAKAAQVTTAAAGENVTYTVTVKNDGSSAAWGLTWHDVMDSALVSPPAVPMLAQADIDGVPLLPTDYSESFGAGTTSTFAFGPAISLPAGSTLTLLYSGKVNGGVVRGQAMPNTATVDSYTSLPGGGVSYGPVSATATVTAVAPALTIIKSASDAQVQRGQVITYTVTVTNVGDGPATNCSVDDTLPADVAYVPGSSLGNGSVPVPDPLVAGQHLVWGLVGDLAAGQSTTLQFRALITSAAAFGLASNVAHAAALDGAGVSVPADASTSNPADTNPSDTATATVRITNPQLTVTKTPTPGQDLFVQAGQPVIFDVVVTNSGDTTLPTVPLAEVYDATRLQLNSISIVGPPPSGISGGSGSVSAAQVGPLAPSQSTTWTFNFTALAPTGAAPDTASVSAIVDEFGDPVTGSSVSANVTITAPSLAITKTLHAGQSANVPVGATVAYDLAVTNTGDSQIATLPLSDTFDSAHLAFVSANPAETNVSTPSVSWSDITGAGTLAPGATTTVTATFRVTAPGAAIADTATASGTDVNGDPVPADTATNATITGTRPVLTIAKAASVTTAAAGDTVTYTVSMHNTGDAPAWDVALLDAMAPQTFGGGATLADVAIDGVPLAPVTGYAADFASNPVSITLSSATPLAAGSTLTVTYVGRVRGGVGMGETMPNTATATYTSLSGPVPGEGSYGPISANATVTAAAPALVISKSASDAYVQRGEVLTYTVTVTNVGDGPAFSASVDDTLPAGLGYVAGTTQATWPSGSNAADPAIVGAHLTWIPNATLQAGESLTLHFRAQVSAGAALGDATNVAHAAAVDGAGTPVPADASASNPADTNPFDTAAVTVRVTDPHVTVAKTPAPGQDLFVQSGEPVAFHIVVTNSGDTTIAAQPVGETFDASRLSFSEAALTNAITGPAVSSNQVTGTVGPLSPGTSASLDITFTALAPTGAANDTVTVSGGLDEFGDPVNAATASAGVTITNPQVTVNKVLSASTPSPVRLGGTVSFDIGVHNTGDTTITSLPLTDTVDPGLRYVLATVLPDNVTTSVAGTVLGWNDLTTAFGPLVPGQSATITVSFIAEQPGLSFNDTATVSGVRDVHSDTSGNVSAAGAAVAVWNPADITWVKRADPPNGTIMLPGQQITYFLDVANHGGVMVPAASLVDTVSSAADYVPGTLALASGNTTSALTDAQDADAGFYLGSDRTVHVSFGDVQPGTTQTAMFKVTVAPEDRSFFGVLNVATLLSGSTPLTDTLPVYHPVDPITIEKTATDVNGGKLQPGDQILWTIKVTNVGLTPTTHVVVKDNVPAGTTYVNGSISGPGANASAVPHLLWTIGTLPVGGAVTLTFKSRVNAGLPSGTTIHNQAVVYSDQSRPKYSDNPATPVANDATLVRTGGDERPLLLTSLLAIALGLALLAFGALRRRREA